MTAWYANSRDAFLRDEIQSIVGMLASEATRTGLHIDGEQHEEWEASVGVLQSQLVDRVQHLRNVLAASDLAPFREVLLEYDFRRRGLRLDCVLLGDGIVAIVEFKRTKLSAADRDQVSNYCINLLEFHEATRDACNKSGCIIVPVLCLTEGLVSRRKPLAGEFYSAPWNPILRRPIECDRSNLGDGLREALSLRRSTVNLDCNEWRTSRFSPSSTIIDAAISLYGDHDVASIAHHAAPIELIRQVTEEIAEVVLGTLRQKQRRVVFLSGSPGAGKTLVGLQLAFDARLRNEAVFVTGNAPLVDVLTEALKQSYRRGSRTREGMIRSGYSREHSQVLELATFKLVKAHQFLGERGSHTRSADGRVVIFDEAQRTYEKGRTVLGRQLEEDEAELILESLAKSYPGEGVVVVALLGHNQAINRGELGAGAWFDAANKLGWHYSVGDDTLALELGDNQESWATAPRRGRLKQGHLPHSLRYYRNGDIERWAAATLDGSPPEARRVASGLADVDTVWLTRDLAEARRWAKNVRVGAERAGLVASGQARRLAAEGLFVELKPDIAQWMLASSGDVRSSNMLETVQNQFQVQGLELDYTIVCWDLDLRRDQIADRTRSGWQAFKLKGATWQRDRELAIAKNSYRVLLTRARKGMVIFVPTGDATGEDETRLSMEYDSIANYLLECGARMLR